MVRLDSHPEAEVGSPPCLHASSHAHHLENWQNAIGHRELSLRLWEELLTNQLAWE